SFPDLKTAVHAHTGRLLAYALPSGVESEAQHQLIERALEARPLDDKYRGIAPTLRGLAGTWAQDPDYASKVAAVANAIRYGLVVTAGPIWNWQLNGVPACRNHA